MTRRGEVVCHKLVLAAFLMAPLWYAFDAWIYVMR